MSLLPEIKALGTVWWIELFDEIDENKKQIIYDDLLLFINNFENKYSRFKPNSEISKLNNERKLINPDVCTVEILKYGQVLYEKTGGLFNFLVGEVLESRGYDAEYSFTVQNLKVSTANPLTDLIIKQDEIILRRGKVDLGGFGKGYLIDLLSQKLKDKYRIKYFLINGGGDIYATSDNEKPIVIYLEHPTEVNTYLETTTLFNQGFAASSPHKRSWRVAGKTYNHIVNDEEFFMIDGTFVKAKTTCEADAFATALLLMESTKIIDFADKNDIEVAFVSDSTITYSKKW